MRTPICRDCRDCRHFQPEPLCQGVLVLGWCAIEHRAYLHRADSACTVPGVAWEGLLAKTALEAAGD